MKILRDLNTRVERFLKAKRADIVAVDKEEKECIIDIAVPAERNTKVKETDRMEEYQILAREITKMWDVKTRTALIVVSALGAV